VKGALGRRADAGGPDVAIDVYGWMVLAQREASPALIEVLAKGRLVRGVAGFHADPLGDVRYEYSGFRAFVPVDPSSGKVGSLVVRGIAAGDDCYYETPPIPVPE